MGEDCGAGAVSCGALPCAFRAPCSARSWHVARLVGARSGLPAYVCVPGQSYLATVGYYTAGWMGRAYDPFLLKSDPNSDSFEVSRLALSPVVTKERSSARRTLLGVLDDGP